jgi:hypothetical protein
LFRLRNNSGTLEFNRTTELVIPDISGIDIDLALQPRFSKRGSISFSNETYGSRNLTLRFNLVAKTDIEYIQRMREIRAFCLPERYPLYIEDTTNDRRALVRLQNHTPSKRFDGTRYRFESVSLSFAWMDAIFERITESTQNETLTNNATFQINIDSPEIVYPIFEITPQGQNTSFRIVNESNGSQFLYESQNFESTDTLVMDSQFGTFKIGAQSTDILVVEGGPIFLEPGANILRYTTPDSDIELVARWRNIDVF